LTGHVHLRSRIDQSKDVNNDAVLADGGGRVRKRVTVGERVAVDPDQLSRWSLLEGDVERKIVWVLDVNHDLFHGDKDLQTRARAQGAREKVTERVL
jgi:hypothetical protein